MKIHLAFGCVVASAAFLTGCATHAGSILPGASSQATQALPVIAASVAREFVVPDSGPPACKGQKTTGQYASDTEKFLTKGGSICIPAFGGLGGSVSYPPANPSVSVSLISSTTNYNHKLPSLHKGTPIFYLQLSIPSGTTFGQNAPAGGGLTGKTIKPASTYTVFGKAVIFGVPYDFKPCYAVATKGKYGGVLGGVGTLLKGVSVPAAASGVIEIYAGKFTGGKC
ncbi:MAG: hypothetical protein JOZ01_03610 [Candidatus Eremiobacteraeota bacterium]|nr:hypothetical protein [Candidatus Eremiobacteraeota bacterium]